MIPYFHNIINNIPVGVSAIFT